MSAATAPKLYTFEEFCEVIRDGQKADLIDGEIILSSPDSLKSNEIRWFLGDACLEQILAGGPES